MSYRGYVSVDIEIIKDKGIEWAKSIASADKSFVFREESAILSTEWDASYYDTAVDEVCDLLEDLHTPLDTCRAHVHYESHDEPFDDGAIINFVIENGKITSFQESRTVMVECEPWFDIDLTKEEE